MNPIEINEQFTQTLDFINRTDRNIFLTGKAGTGKTTLLKYIRANTYKKLAVVAPTGVAAINAGGATIHSFFQFSFAPFVPVINGAGLLDFSRTRLPVVKYNRERLTVINNLELLIIDEVSMVRADLLDLIDLTLRVVRKRTNLPFGGVQVLMIGDMFQLPPVTQPSEMALLRPVYRGIYFFDSLVLRTNPFVFIELQKIYRQSEERFVSLLNKVRDNHLDPQDLETLNAHYHPSAGASDDSYITLTTHNKKAEVINSEKLAALSGPSFSFKADVNGVFAEKSYPAEERLVLKVGARVMFLRNNPEKNYYNGKTGSISRIEENKVFVRCEEKTEIEVGRESWSNISYSADGNSNAVKEEILGTFSQIPLRLAWAITIHKSQGLTFDKVIIDAAEAFSAGQVYVALSRCRSLEGLRLSSRITPQSLFSDSQILQFSNQRPEQAVLNKTLEQDAERYKRTVLLSVFDLSGLARQREELGALVVLHKQRLNKAGIDWFTSLAGTVDQLVAYALTFTNRLQVFFAQHKQLSLNSALQQRVQQAAIYFHAEFLKLRSLLESTPLLTESKIAATDLSPVLKEFLKIIHFRMEDYEACLNGFEFERLIESRNQVRLPEMDFNVFANAGNLKAGDGLNHPILFQRLLKLRDELCDELRRPIYLVANQKALNELSLYLPTTTEALLQIKGFGKSKVTAFGDRFLSVIRDFLEENGFESNMSALQLIPKRRERQVSKQKADKHQGKSREVSFQLFREGLSAAEIAARRGFTVSTIQSHLAYYVGRGEIELQEVLSARHQALIEEALEKKGGAESLSALKAILPPELGYEELRFFIAHKNIKEAQDR